jgi:probable extracellular repeat, HAF family
MSLLIIAHLFLLRAIDSFQAFVALGVSSKDCLSVKVCGNARSRHRIIDYALSKQRENIMKLLIATISLALSVMTNAEEAKSIKHDTPSGGSQIIITDLGLLPGGTFSSGLAINNEPVIVGLANDSTFALQRPFWDANTGVIIGFAGNFNPASTAIPEHANDSREMAGTEIYGDNVYQGIYWNSTGQAFVLLGLAGVDPFYGGLHTRAHGINSLGQLVGTGKEAEPNFYTHAALWPNKDTEAMDLGFLGQGIPLNYSEAYGVNDLSHVVGNSAVGSAIRGFLWRNGQMINLRSLSGSESDGTSASAINNTGLLVGKSLLDPVIWTYDIANPNSTPTISQLPIPSGFFTAQPAAVNDAGDVAGYAGSPNIDSHAILWRNGMAIDLGVWPGGHYSVANGINNLGQIVGTGTVAGDNLDHALMWTVTDEPTPTPTATARPTPTPRSNPSPRGRPTPAPRP